MAFGVVGHGIALAVPCWAAVAGIGLIGFGLYSLAKEIRGVDIPTPVDPQTAKWVAEVLEKGHAIDPDVLELIDPEISRLLRDS